MSVEDPSGRLNALQATAGQAGMPNEITARFAEIINGNDVPLNSVQGSPAELAVDASRGLRIGADSTNLPIQTPPHGAGEGDGFLSRISSFFQKWTEPPQVNGEKVILSTSPKNEPQATQELNDTLERFEASQRFAAGTALLSSLTQSVLSSSKRLTQGQ